MVQNSALLLVEIPRTNDKKELSAEQMFASLHGILKPSKSLFKDDYLSQDRISFEIASIDQRIHFYVWVPEHLQAFVEGQLYAQYPTAQIKQLSEDYAARDLKQQVIFSSELVLTDNEVIPIKTFPSFEVDPLAAITATLAKLNQANEELWVQVIIRPISDNWHKKSIRMADKIRAGSTFTFGNNISYFSQVFGALVKPPEMGESKTGELSERNKTRITAIEEKSKKLGYQVKVRIVYAGNDEITAKQRMQAMVGTFKQFNTTNLNGFQSKYPSFDRNKITDYKNRSFPDKGYILNIEEVASLYHLPHTSVETPNIVWATTKTAEPPSTLPRYGSTPDDQLSLFGITNFRGVHDMFGILRSDRGRHMYIIGQTGTGKSGLLELLTLSDIFYKQGFAIIDPHGDYATNVLKYIPKDRIKDVVYFNPADSQFPVAFNPLEITDSSSKGQVSSELVGVLKRMFDSWGPRLEYILRYTILALLDYPNSTMLDITRMLTEKQFRNDVIAHTQDPVVRKFWDTEFASWNEKFASEAVAPVLNKVGAFTANPLVRNIIGQPTGSFKIRQIMDEGKILIVNLSRGLIGEDNAAILGSMFVTKIQLAAMSRADIPDIKNRRPFYLYVDEFQNFATDSFAVILSEARKYGLNLTVANQYISQMAEMVRDAVFGNVGTMVSFRVSPDDSPFLVKYFEPQFEASDLSQFHNRLFVTSMSINGEKASAFSASTLNIPEVTADYSGDIINYSRTNYAHDIKQVEEAIRQQQSAPIRVAGQNTTQQITATNNTPSSQANTIFTQPDPINPTPIVPKLTESQKRRLRRKRAAEAQKIGPESSSEALKPITPQNNPANTVDPPKSNPNTNPNVQKKQNHSDSTKHRNEPIKQAINPEMTNKNGTKLQDKPVKALDTNHSSNQQLNTAKRAHAGQIDRKKTVLARHIARTVQDTVRKTALPETRTDYQSVNRAQPTPKATSNNKKPTKDNNLNDNQETIIRLR
ncbi:MAG: type IV secretion system DNA-binding domain-containing protein [Patescibacteria group bacterium]|jgi:hypothetical protein|nr:type IV secretion system DNA-binding domain-containing protein [Patescibacteria group bacterium]